jgi:hypothetical protein
MGREIFPMMQFRIEFVVSLDHQAKFYRRLGQSVLQSRRYLSISRVISDGGTNAVIGRYQREFARGVRRVEHLARRTRQKRGPRRVRNLRQLCPRGPLPQGRWSSGVGQATLQEKPGQFLGRARDRRCWKQCRESQNPLYRRNSISIGPSRRPCVN